MDLGGTVPDELLAEVCSSVQETVTKTIPERKKCKKANGYPRRPHK